jgi:hypothetical protein
MQYCNIDWHREVHTQLLIMKTSWHRSPHTGQDSNGIRKKTIHWLATCVYIETNGDFCRQNDKKLSSASIHSFIHSTTSSAHICTMSLRFLSYTQVQWIRAQKVNYCSIKLEFPPIFHSIIFWPTYRLRARKSRDRSSGLAESHSTWPGDNLLVWSGHLDHPLWRFSYFILGSKMMHVHGKCLW